MLTADDVDAAARRLLGIVERTPVLRSRSLDSAVGGEVFVKAENLQRTGSFKLRGAANKLIALGADAAPGVVTFSSGNHGLAVACAARDLGVPATVFVPMDAPAAKLHAGSSYGATVLRYDRYVDDREALVASFTAESGTTLVHPYEDPWVMAGQGTAAAELLDSVGQLDVLLVPIGGGGLISGCATVAKARQPGIRVVGIEPAAADDTRRSLLAGVVRALSEVPPTICDGLQAQAPGREAFEVIRRLVDEVVTVTDEQVRTAVRFLFERQKVVVEPSGAVGVAALLHGAVDVAGQRTGVILSGGNVDLDRFRRIAEGRAQLGSGSSSSTARSAAPIVERTTSG